MPTTPEPKRLFIARYPVDDFDEGINVGPFESEADAEAFLAANPHASDVEPVLSDGGGQRDEWTGYVVELRTP